jgi:arsenite methyltransferase
MTQQSQPSPDPLVDAAGVHAAIQDKYRSVASNPDAQYHFFTGRTAADHIGYPTKELDDLPEEVLAAFAGVANPFHWGLPDLGETVVDIGSGAGLDSVIAARAVGSEGSVVGVDMTRDMLIRARKSAASLGLDNLEFREGRAENLPVADESVDLVISNGVLNLVPDKLRAYQEIHRVLKPGGRFQIADITVEKEIPEGTRRNIDLWAG